MKRLLAGLIAAGFLAGVIGCGSTATTAPKAGSGTHKTETPTHKKIETPTHKTETPTHKELPPITKKEEKATHKDTKK